jgi:MraZ protein
LAFTGTFEHTLDAKNRLTIPSKFRAELSKGVYLSRAIENVISLYPAETYTAMADQALAHFTNPLSAQARETRRLLFGTAQETELDSAGRVMLTPRFLEHAGIGREVVITGVGDCLEIWERSAWADYDTGLTQRAPELTESLGHTA